MWRRGQVSEGEGSWQKGNRESWLDKGEKRREIPMDDPWQESLRGKKVEKKGNFGERVWR